MALWKTILIIMHTVKETRHYMYISMVQRTLSSLSPYINNS